MKKLFIFLISILFFGFSTAYGGVEKCVDSAGKVTYTDKGCKTKESAEDTYLPGVENNSRKYREGPSTVSFKVGEIGALTKEATKQCSMNAVKYFANINSDIDKSARSEFLEIKDRTIQQAGVIIELAGVIHYKTKKQPHNMKILCTASKSRNSDWVLAFREAGKSKQDAKN